MKLTYKGKQYEVGKLYLDSYGYFVRPVKVSSNGEVLIVDGMHLKGLQRSELHSIDEGDAGTIKEVEVQNER